jgi:UDP-glucose 4-epimerase
MIRVLVTGGAGFIGNALVTQLLERGDRVTVLDSLVAAEPDWDAPFAAELRDGRLRFIHGDVTDLATVEAAMAAAGADGPGTGRAGTDLVVHLAASTDIAGGFADPSLDFDGCIRATWNVAEAMRRQDVRRILYASSGVVYGPMIPAPSAESDGPLQPQSHYAAGKLAGEAILSGFAHLYGWRALAFRFGNTVGPRSNHGVVFDFVVKLLRDPTRLEILGDGRQAKPYVAVDDVARALLHAEAHAPDRPFGVYNVGTSGVVTVDRLADLVIEAMGLDPAGVAREHTGTGGGWRGDTDRVEFDMSALHAIGWQPRFSAEEALTRAAMGAWDRVLAAGPPYLTSFERRALAKEPAGASAAGDAMPVGARSR